ncbi:MAG: radical SAM protein, partial [Candidatus Cryptobacteroides sp.]
VSLVNQPSGKYSVAGTVDALKEFKGEFVLQTMFLKGPAFSSLEEENVAAWRKIALELRPREIMVYTIDRQTPAEGLGKCTVEEMEAVTRPLAEAGIKIQIKG